MNCDNSNSDKFLSHHACLSVFLITLLFILAGCADSKTAPDELEIFGIKFDDNAYITENPERLGGATISGSSAKLERPHDGYSVKRGLSEEGFFLTKGYILFTAPGSSLRFKGEFENSRFRITTGKDDWLHFRRTDGGWVYLAGKGVFHDTQKSKAFKLGAERTEGWFLASFIGADPIAKERAIYELERYPDVFDSSEVRDRIRDLPAADSHYISAAASYVLGNLGDREDVPYLKAALTGSEDKFVKYSVEDAIQRIESR